MTVGLHFRACWLDLTVLDLTVMLLIKLIVYKISNM